MGDDDKSAKTKAEANPLASKLGLGSSVPRAVPVIAAPAGAISRAIQPRQGRGPGRGRGGAKTVVPGRGGRPLYAPLMQVMTASLVFCCHARWTEVPGEVVDTASIVTRAATTIQQQQLSFVVLHLVRHEALFCETFVQLA